MEKLNGLIVKMYVVLEKMGSMDVPVSVGRSICMYLDIDKPESTLRVGHKL